MRPAARVVVLALLSFASLAIALLTGPGCSTAVKGDAGNCQPAPGSCDAPSPQMSPFDPSSDCVAAPVAVAGVCDTSVDRCSPSAGIGPVCAFAPDGGVFVAILSDNEMLTATGWHFDQPWMSFGDPGAIPSDEMATPEQSEQCARAQCSPPCPSVKQSIFGFSCADAGEAGGTPIDATSDAKHA